MSQAVDLFAKGQYDETIVLAKQGLQLYDASPSNPSLKLKFLNLLGAVQLSLRMPESVDTFTEAINLAKSIESKELTNLLNNAGAAYLTFDRKDEAKECFADQLRYTSENDYDGIAAALGSLAIAFIDSEEQAVSFLETALQLPLSPKQAVNTTQKFITVLRKNNRYLDAVQVLHTMFGALQKYNVLSELVKLLEQCLQDVEAQEAYPQALQTYGIAAEIYLSISDFKHSAEMLFLAAMCYKKEGNYPSALSLLEGSLQLFEQVNSREDIWRVKLRYVLHSDL